MEYTLSITCPLCNTTAVRTSSAPFIYLDEAGIVAHAQHTAECQGAGMPPAYTVVRTPNVYRQLPGDPVPPEGGA